MKMHSIINLEKGKTSNGYTKIIEFKVTLTLVGGGYFTFKRRPRPDMHPKS